MKVYWPNFAKRDGLIIVVVQDCVTLEILMVAFTDEAGLLETLRTGEAVYYSTSRKCRWKKGEESGAIQIVRGILIDCDGDAVVYRVEQKGSGACHTRAKSCFFRRVVGMIRDFLTAPDFDPKKDGLEERDVDVSPRLYP